MRRGGERVRMGAVMTWMGGGGGGDGGGTRGGLESALPGEWAAFLLVIAVIVVIGAAILVAVCLGHERVMVRRNARQMARRLRE